MSTVYSLICFGGRTGKTATMTIASPCVVTLTNHGLRNGTGVAFSTTGALPTGVTAGTTYYARPTAANTFNLYDTAEHAIAGGTTGRVNTSGSQSGTHTIKGAYFLDLTSAQLARYGSAGSERIYDGLNAWNSGRSGASKLDVEVCEIGEAWDNWIEPALTINVPAGAIRIETKVDGVRSAGYHQGQISDGTTNYGYVARRVNYSDTTLTYGVANITIDGITIMREAGGYGPTGVNASGFRGFLINSIVRGLSSSGTGVAGSGVAGGIINCLVMGWGTGIVMPTYNEGVAVYNCTVTKNTNGIMASANYQPCYAYVINTVSIGNTTTNWDTSATVATGFRYCSNNAGGTSEVWKTSTGTRVEITEASPFTATFADWTNYDFTPTDTSSQLVDAGAEYYGASAFDLADDVRPSYENGTTTYYDIGAFEFDHGYGGWPATATISLTNIVSGTRVRITRDDTGAELYNDVPGTSLSFDTGYIGAFSVVGRKASATPFYREFQASGTTVADQTTSIKFLQQLDE